MTDRTDDARDSRLKDSLMQAIQRHCAVMITYSNEVRTIEPHLLGRTTAGNLAIRAWQLGGGSVSQKGLPGWRMFRLDRMTHVEVLDISTKAPREAYNPNDFGMQEILARVPA